MDKHGRQGPATTIPNNKGQADDSIKSSQGIIIYQGGYLPFHEGPKSNHRLLWIKISHGNYFGKTSPPIGPLQPVD